VPDDDVVLGPIELMLAWSVRGNPAQAAFVAETHRVLSLVLPLEPNTIAHRRGASLLWAGPKSWLLVAGSEGQREDFDQVRVALNAVGGALFDVSAGYVGWSISGPGAARVVNRTCSLDLHPRTFGAGRCAQSVLGHVPAMFYRPTDASGFIVMVPRSFAVDARRALCARSNDER
jgi:sarcosine oxidase subunit gamma